MWSYEEIKKWVDKNKDKMLLTLCFVLVFLVGFGAGRFEQQWRREKLQSNYTTNFKPAPTNTASKAAAALPAKQPTGVVAGTSTTTPCVVKGNISSSGAKIYHIKGGALYNVVKPEQCFNTEAEAVAAGFRKSGR